VVGTNEGSGIAVVGAAQTVASVATDVQKSAYLTLAVAHYQNGVLAHVSSNEIPRIWNLTFVAQEEPTTGENML
jgi:hypothetical protein